MIETDLSSEVIDPLSAVAASEACVRWVPFPSEVIVFAVRWYLRFNLSYRGRGGAAGRARLGRVLPPGAVGVEGDTQQGGHRRSAGLPRTCSTRLVPSAWHHVERYANNPIEADHLGDILHE
jgi:hypothetical protein